MITTQYCKKCRLWVTGRLSKMKHRKSKPHHRNGGHVMIASLICALGLTFFPGQATWYELDTRGIEWTVGCHVTKDGMCLIGEAEAEAYDALADGGR